MRRERLLPLAFLGGVLPVWADAPPPPEFWQYLLEYGNDQAEVIDPLDLDTMSHVDAPASTSTPPAVPAAQKEKE